MRIVDWESADRVTRSLDDRIREIVRVPLLDGLLLAEVGATTAGTAVVHGLGRTPLGVLIVRADTAATYVLDQFNQTSFTVTASADSTVNLWVF